MSKKVWVLAFDVEKAGMRDVYPVLAIGASVVDENLQEVDRFSVLGYVPDLTKFEERTYREFWSRFPEILKSLTYVPAEGEVVTVDSLQQSMIVKLQEFRRNVEMRAKTEGVSLKCATDNGVYDGHVINSLINRYLPVEELTMPYLATHEPATNDQSYSSMINSHSLQRGYMASAEPSFVSSGQKSYGNRLEELYDVPPTTVSHDHNPANDAFTIARDVQVVFGIQTGRFVRRVGA